MMTWTKKFSLRVAGLLIWGMQLPATLTAQNAAIEPAIDFSGFDHSTKPADDFFQFVNGKWIAETPIPPDKSRWGAFVILAEKSRDAILLIIDELTAQKDLPHGSNPQKIRDLYQSYLNVDSINQMRSNPILPDLRAIDAIPNKYDLAARWANAGRTSVPSPLDMWISQDAKDSTQYRVHITQSGLGLPDRDFYLQSDERSMDLQNKYKAYMAKLLEFADIENAQSAADAAYELEKSIATVQWSRVDNRDRLKTYNKFNIHELKNLTPTLDWNAYFQISGIADESEFIVRQPDFLEKLDQIIQETPLSTWKTYLKIRLLSASAPYLSQDFFDLDFDFYSRTLSGQMEPESRTKQAVDLVNSLLGEAVGQVYVERHFPPEAKKRMLELVGNLKLAMHESIESLDWMDAPTKAKAIDKLNGFTTKIGYPNKWKDYSRLEIRSDDLAGNVRRAAEFNHNQEIEKLGKPIDREEWFMTPQTVNAYYNPMLNEIVFPAAILQPPFFNQHADDAVNYGAIGMVIGHEIGHGFDDQGRKSDKEGNLVDWWSESSASAYESKARILVNQYNQFEPIEGFRVNGQLTLGENIGDLGGLTLAWKAFKKTEEFKNQLPIDNFPASQRFFLSFAQIWRVKSTTELAIRRLKTDTHSPPRFRVNGPLHNFNPFYEVFNISESDAMWIDESDRVSIW